MPWWSTSTRALTLAADLNVVDLDDAGVQILEVGIGHLLLEGVNLGLATGSTLHAALTPGQDGNETHVVRIVTDVVEQNGVTRVDTRSAALGDFLVTGQISMGGGQINAVLDDAPAKATALKGSCALEDELSYGRDGGLAVSGLEMDFDTLFRFDAAVHLRQLERVEAVFTTHLDVTFDLDVEMEQDGVAKTDNACRLVAHSFAKVGPVPVYLNTQATLGYSAQADVKNRIEITEGRYWRGRLEMGVRYERGAGVTRILNPEVTQGSSLHPSDQGLFSGAVVSDELNSTLSLAFDSDFKMHLYKVLGPQGAFRTRLDVDLSYRRTTWVDGTLIDGGASVLPFALSDAGMRWTHNAEFEWLSGWLGEQIQDQFFDEADFQFSQQGDVEVYRLPDVTLQQALTYDSTQWQIDPQRFDVTPRWNDIIFPREDIFDIYVAGTDSGEALSALAVDGEIEQDVFGDLRMRRARHERFVAALPTSLGAPIVAVPEHEGISVCSLEPFADVAGAVSQDQPRTSEPYPQTESFDFGGPVAGLFDMARADFIEVAGGQRIVMEAADADGARGALRIAFDLPATSGEYTHSSPELGVIEGAFEVQDGAGQNITFQAADVYHDGERKGTFTADVTLNRMSRHYNTPSTDCGETLGINASLWLWALEDRGDGGVVGVRNRVLFQYGSYAPTPDAVHEFLTQQAR